MLYLLPGTGANHRMYDGPWLELPDTIFLDWPAYEGEVALGEMADRLIAEHDIKSDDTVGGSSLGGMVSLEIAARLGCERVVLIGSATTPAEINRFRLRLAPMVKLLPVRLIQAVAGILPSRATAMFASADRRFFRAMCLAIPKWPGRQETAARLIRIHGARDPVIPCPNNCHVIPRAGHMVAMTHAEQCARALEELL